MPPRVRLPRPPAAGGPSSPAGPIHGSPDHATQEPTSAPAAARANESCMNQLGGLPVDASAAKGPADGAALPAKPAAGLPHNTFFTVDLPPPAASGGAGPDKPGRVHVDASVDIEPPATAAGGPSVPPHSPHVMSEMQMLQETQRLGMQQQADMQKMAIENQVLTARLKLEMDLTTAVTDFIKKQGEAIKHAAAG